MSNLSRRNFLKFGAIATGTLTATACGAVGRRVVQREMPASLSAPQPPLSEATSTPNAPIARFLNRAGYGARPGDFEAVVAMGYEAYVNQQLDAAGVENAGTDLIMRGIDLYHYEIGMLVDQEPVDVRRALFHAAIVRPLTSNRQLEEAVVEFWSDHFNIYLRKNQLMPMLKLVDDRDVIRPHALGKFRDLLMASASSPAMLIYLDNARNEKGEPNENYAREIMELHTLGVHADYTQTDIQEAARALTGWSVARRGRKQGQAILRLPQHDNGEKTILGEVFPAGQGVKDIEQLVDLLASHPATAQFIATKLVRRFVADVPPANLVTQVAQIFTDTDGDIKAMLRHIFLSDDFATAPPKLKRPFTYAISAFRAMHADVGQSRQGARLFRQLGQPLFMWAPPNGYPDVSAAWRSNLLPRWNFALALAHDYLPNIKIPYEAVLSAGNVENNVEDALQLYANLLLHHPLDDQALTLFTNYIGSPTFDNPRAAQRTKDAVALMLASPAFQWT